MDACMHAWILKHMYYLDETFTIIMINIRCSFKNSFGSHFKIHVYSF